MVFYTSTYALAFANRLQSVAVTILLTARCYIAMMALEITPEEYNRSVKWIHLGQPYAIPW